MLLSSLCCRFSDKEVQRDVKMFPFKVVNKDTKPCIEVELKEGKKVFQAEEISAMVLTKMKETAEAYLGKDIKNAVVTVPGISSSVFSRITVTSHICPVPQIEFGASLQMADVPSALSSSQPTSTMRSVRPRRTLVPSPA